MESITFTSKSKRKLDILLQVATEMGIKGTREREITDEEMAVPGNKPTKKQIEDWLAKDDGESFSEEETFKMVEEELVKYRKSKKNGH